MDIYSLSEKDRYKLLEQLALKLIRGEVLTKDESEFIGYGIMSMTCGDNLNDAFGVKKSKSTDHNKHAIRYALVKREQDKGNTLENAMMIVTRLLISDSPDCPIETIRTSYKIQKAIQEKHNSMVKLYRGENSTE